MKPHTRVIAFYLPQFYPIPENDEWWGKGFTEWTNVARAKPLFRGHYQPHIPADLGFYDLRCPETRAAQAELAKAYGVEGFCYYHYWFAGRRILERPFEEVLKSGEPDLPFCICWANHSWNNIWQGIANKTLIEQTYPGPADHEAHFNYLLNAFTDPRYIQVDGKPLFLIYDPQAVPDVKHVTDHWREMALRAGLKGLYLVSVSFNNLHWNPHEHGFDASTWQPLPSLRRRVPWRYPAVKLKTLLANTPVRLAIYEYAEVVNSLIRKTRPSFVDYPTVLPNWDNTPRSTFNGMVFNESTPELFRGVLQRAISMVTDMPDDRRIIFLKAWNEWAEGNHIEPDLKFGHGYLQVIREEITAS